MDGLKYLRFDVGGWSERRAADALGVSLKTLRRYESGTAPAMALRLVAILAAGHLGAIDSAWEGWHLVRGALVSPENVCFTPGDVRAIQYRDALISAQRRQLTENSAADQEHQHADNGHQRQHGQGGCIRPGAEAVENLSATITNLDTYRHQLGKR